MWSVWGICSNWRISACKVWDGNWGKLTEWHEHIVLTSCPATTPLLLTVNCRVNPQPPIWDITELVKRCIHTHVRLESFFTDFFLMYTYSQSDGHDDRVKYAQKSPNRLTLHLQIPDVPPSQRPRSGTADRRAVAGTFIPPFSNSRVREDCVFVFWHETFSCCILLFVYV